MISQESQKDFKVEYTKKKHLKNEDQQKTDIRTENNRQVGWEMIFSLYDVMTGGLPDGADTFFL